MIFSLQYNWRYLNPIKVVMVKLCLTEWTSWSIVTITMEWGKNAKSGLIETILILSSIRKQAWNLQESFQVYLLYGYRQNFVIMNSNNKINFYNFFSSHWHGLLIYQSISRQRSSKVFDRFLISHVLLTVTFRKALLNSWKTRSTLCRQQTHPL